MTDVVEQTGWQDNLADIVRMILHRVDTETKNSKAFLLSLIWQLDNYERSYSDEVFYPSETEKVNFRYEVRFAGLDITYIGTAPKEDRQEDYVMQKLTSALKESLKKVVDKLGNKIKISDVLNYD